MENLEKRAWKVFRQVQEKRPLVQCITNFVTVNDCANMILAHWRYSKISGSRIPK